MPRRNNRAEDEDPRTIAAAILAEYMADWDPEDVREALSDLESVDVTYVTRDSAGESQS
jgi:hypothetical protein